MADVAEMILDGSLCERCGVPVDGETPGYPRKCRACSRPQKPHSKSEARRINEQTKPRKP